MLTGRCPLLPGLPHNRHHCSQGSALRLLFPHASWRPTTSRPTVGYYRENLLPGYSQHSDNLRRPTPHRITNPPDTLVNPGTVVYPNAFPQIDLRESSSRTDVKCCSRAFADYCCRRIAEAEESVSSPTQNATYRTAGYGMAEWSIDGRFFFP